MCLHCKSQDKFKRTIRHLTSRSNGKGYAWLKLKLTQYIRGWMTYYRHADMKNFIRGINQWYCRRLRMYIWKSWKLPRTRFTNLQKCGINRQKSREWSNSRKGYWHISKSWILHRAIPTEKLEMAGYPSMNKLYIQLHRS